MVRCSITHHDDKTATLSVYGHADNKTRRRGFNAVCGMVSVLVQSCMYGCLTFGGGIDEIHYGNGCCEFRYKENDITEALVKSFLEGLAAIRHDFPSEVDQCKTYT